MQLVSDLAAFISQPEQPGTYLKPSQLGLIVDLRVRPGFMVSLIFIWNKQIGLHRKTAVEPTSQEELRKKISVFRMWGRNAESLYFRKKKVLVKLLPLAI